MTAPVSLSDFLSDTPEAKGERSRAVVNAVAKIFEERGIDPSEVGRIDQIKLYQGFYKDAEGEAHTVDMTGIAISPAWADGPAWPVIQPGKPVVVRSPRLPLVKRDDRLKRCMTLPDIQIGYYFDGAGNMHPSHDEAAIQVTLEVVKQVRPDMIVCHGDNLDLPELGKYRLTPAFARTTQATIDRGTLFNAELRAAAGDECDIWWLEGNHEFRMSAYLLDNAQAAFGLKVGNAPGSWPVLSVPNLCRLDEQGITYVSGYPANEVWVNERLRVVHGNLVVSNGSTAHRYLANERSSIIYGHIHRREWAERTRATFDGPRTILAMSPGCLARIDGGVPSTKGGVDLEGTPVKVTEDWQQGLAVFAYEPGDGRFLPEMVPIIDGWTLYHGREFRSTVDVEGMNLDA